MFVCSSISPSGSGRGRVDGLASWTVRRAHDVGRHEGFPRHLVAFIVGGVGQFVDLREVLLRVRAAIQPVVCFRRMKLTFNRTACGQLINVG